MKITITTEVEVPQEWLDFCLHYNDLFRTDHCGYWAHGVKRDEKLGWLVYVDETGEGGRPSAEQVRDAAREWRSHFGPLPKGFYRLDEAAVAKAFEVGCKKFGIGWYEDGATDALRYDYVIQVALLGEVVYG